MKNNRNFFILFALMLLSFSLISCGGKNEKQSADNQLGKMEVVIPDVLKDNPEIVEYIEGMSEVVDQYAMLIDDMVGDLEGFEGKDWNELKIGEQLKLTKAAAQFAVKAAPITAKWAEFELKRNMIDQELTEEELMALETVLDRFEKRMEQIEERNQEFFGGVNS
jgi:hypothetical protein